MGIPKRFIQVGCGGFGASWMANFMPHVVNELKLAEAEAVVDINPETFPLPGKHTGWQPKGATPTWEKRSLSMPVQTSR